MVQYNEDTFLVVGGGGFLGRSIVEQLLARGSVVSVFDLRRTFDDPRLRAFHVGDICDPVALDAACAGCSVVIHTASPHAGMPAAVQFKVNVEGTNNIIRACIANSVKKLIYTSSASVIYNGNDLVAGDETIPYCKVPMDAYNESKALGEAAVLKANGSGGLLTCSIRPSGIFGPGDMQAIHGHIENAKQGRWRYRFGSNENLFDMTFVENVSHAHLLAADKIAPDNGIAGEVFIITNDHPTFFWDFPKILYNELGYKNTQQIVVPQWFALGLGITLDTIAYLISPFVTYKPVLTEFRIRVASANRYFNISKAKERLGYTPIYSLYDAIRITAEHYKPK
eukprot:jgi/Hompol1/1623/HPOL_005665-RA